MRIIALAALLALVSFSAHAENTTSVTFTCAPWDGAGLAITVNTQDNEYRLFMWGKAYEELANGGKKIHTNNAKGSSSEGYGESFICASQNKCHDEDMMIEFTTVELRKDGVVKGTIDGLIPFEGTITSDHPFCG